MNTDASTVTIRQRGQLTIPDEIRKAVNWIRPNSAVSIFVEKPDRIVLKPHTSVIDWEKIWNTMKIIRSFKGRGKAIPAWKFLEKDRRSH